VYAWGNNKFGQAGAGSYDVNRVDHPTEIVVPLKGKNVVQIACGAFHRYALPRNEK
jgi:alpha-tubulin suppressor-like RCC1 family protein